MYFYVINKTTKIPGRLIAGFTHQIVSRIFFHSLTLISKVNSLCIINLAFNAIVSKLGSFKALLIFFAIHSGVLFSIINPVSPSFMMSGIAPTGVAATGVPQDIASSMILGSPSVYEGITRRRSVFK